MGAKSVPLDGKGKQTYDGWEFHYNRWEGKESTRDGATRSNFFPAARKGALDPNILQHFGLCPDMMKEKDVLFFINSIYPSVMLESMV
eukprot:426198-Ditylum_brightwellii.AAC.1